MRILMCGDAHGNISHVRYLLSTAKKQNCDRIFVLGDFGLWEHERDGVVFLNLVSAYAHQRGLQVYCLDGNHDNWVESVFRAGPRPDAEGFHELRRAVKYAGRGHQWNWDGKEFIALGGAYSVDKHWRLACEASGETMDSMGNVVNAKAGSLWFPDEEMSDDDMDNILATASPGKVDVMLAHDKPLWSQPGWNRKTMELCLPNQRRLQKAVNQLQPDVYLHGHLHYRYRDAVGVPLSEPPHSTEVYGLDCDPAAAESYKYNQAKSWVVYDTQEPEGVLW